MLPNSFFMSYLAAKTIFEKGKDIFKKNLKNA